MRNVKLDYPFAELHGAVQKKGAINRQKKFRDANGKIIREGKQELYDVVNPRDFKRHPQTPAERAHHERFREAAQSAQAILRAADDSTNPSPELIEELSVWQARFHAQLLTTKNSQPDPGHRQGQALRPVPGLSPSNHLQPSQTSPTAAVTNYIYHHSFLSILVFYLLMFARTRKIEKPNRVNPVIIQIPQLQRSRALRFLGGADKAYTSVLRDGKRLDLRVTLASATKKPQQQARRL